MFLKDGSAFGEWVEGKVRFNTERQIKRLLVKSRKDLIVFCT